MYLLNIHPTRLEAITAHDRTLTRWSLHDDTATTITQVTDAPQDISAIATAPEGAVIAVASLAPIHSRDGSTAYTHYPSGPGFSEVFGDTFTPCEIALREWNDLSVVQTIALPGSGASILSMCFSPDGNWLAVADSCGHLFLIDRSTSQITCTLTHSYGPDLSGLLFDGSSSYLAAGGSNMGGGAVALYRLEHGELHEVIADYYDSDSDYALDIRETVFQPAFSPDGATLAIATSDNNEQPGYLVAFATQSGQPKWYLQLHPETELADGSHLYPAYMYNGYYYCSQLRFTPDGSQLLSGDGSGDILCFDAVDGHLLRRLPTGTDQPVALFDFEPSRSALWALVLFDRDLAFQFRKLPSGEIAWGFSNPNADKAAPAGDDLRLVRVALD